jgi:hypothetical protein
LNLNAARIPNSESGEQSADIAEQRAGSTAAAAGGNERTWKLRRV